MSCMHDASSIKTTLLFEDTMPEHICSSLLGLPFLLLMAPLCKMHICGGPICYQL